MWALDYKTSQNYLPTHLLGESLFILQMSGLDYLTIFVWIPRSIIELPALCHLCSMQVLLL